MPNAVVAVVAVGVALAACAPGTTERERVDFERMRLQQRGSVYGGSPVFANGAIMQAPPAGTIARQSAGDTGVVATGMVDGRAATTIPGAINGETLARGAGKFRIYCAVCHGTAGFGGSTVAENMGPPRPPSLRSARVLAAPPGYIFGVATNGLGRMPSYASALSAQERWDVVAYIQQLTRTPATTRDAIDDSVRAVAIQRMDSLARARGLQ
ncbi:MAG TPA: cytochrome c [Gemmatimonadaceae bacterium]|nr:cytochrome c [Gemmatimonadaceae bacterium]